jgi:hypothetical protein
MVRGISALSDTSQPGTRQLPVFNGMSALNDKSESGLKRLLVVGGISALNDKSKPGKRHFSSWMASRRSTK